MLELKCGVPGLLKALGSAREGFSLPWLSSLGELWVMALAEAEGSAQLQPCHGAEMNAGRGGEISALQILPSWLWESFLLNHLSCYKNENCHGS